MRFVNHHIRASLNDSGCGLTVGCLDAGQKKIMIGYLKIDRSFAISSFHIAGIATVISILAMAASAFDANLSLDGSGHIPCVEIKSSNRYFIHHEVVEQLLVLLFMLHKLVKVIIAAGFAEVVFFAFSNYGRERVLD